MSRAAAFSVSAWPPSPAPSPRRRLFARGRAELSGAARARGRAVRSKRDDRHLRAARRAEIERATGQVVLRREHARRQRQYRYGCGSAGPARRLYGAVRFQLFLWSIQRSSIRSLMILTRTSSRSRSPLPPPPCSPSIRRCLRNPSRELVALIAANPGKYSYASPGAGTQAHRPRRAAASVARS